jgi:hypothetical protein
MLNRKNATVTMTVTATAGAVGGWTIGASTLTGGNATLTNTGNLTLGTGNDVCRISADDATYRLWIGNATAGSASFRVTKGGALTCSGASVSGAITATSGSLGDLTVDGDLTIDGGSLIAGAVTLSESGITIPTGTYASGGRITIGNCELFAPSGGLLNIDGGLHVLGGELSCGSNLNISGTGTIVDAAFFRSTIEATGLGTSASGTPLILTAGNLIKAESSSIRYKEHIAPWRPTWNDPQS